MRAERLRLTGGTDDTAKIAHAADVIRRGGLVAFPTETVYGLGAHAMDDAAVAQIFAAKGRPSGDPLIVHVSDVAAVAQVAASVPSSADALMAAFWPGPLTLIVPRAAHVPLRVTAGGETVAVRIPAHPVAMALLRAAGVPIAAPSANRFSRPSPTTADDVAEDLGDRVDVILDGGPTTHGVESTVVDTCGASPVVLRPGALTLEALRRVVPGITLRVAVARDGSAALASPGTLLKHYAPRAEVRLWTGAAETLPAAVRHDIAAQMAAGRRVGALLVDEDLPAAAGLTVEVASLGSIARLDEAAARLFAALRVLDRAGVDVIVTRDLGRVGLGLTIWDRLFRAAEGRVLESR
ncbi:MAG: threonylcarbamoyl-AMP synthase [Acidobacteria bacterium]|nr:threonylcarbamoyl-AMP synthase [Acidobacteriota bacterium]